ncbi:ATP-binding protein [Actinomadura miaoliensis]|uniref:ATP-binding protein n=1 Tax=Actinomadura miaoliensis TaxID=430685 RepID=A0ABP7WDN1_9ACTN
MHSSSELIHDTSPPRAVPTEEPGIRAGWAWSLPRGPACARHARTLLADALAELGVPRDPIADAKLMVSELATNAYQHAADYGPHELWLAVDDDARPPAEVRCAVFDAFVDARLPGYSWTSGDCGRGLSIVAEMSQGRWGLLHTLSRLGTPVPGKAVWFVVPTRVA